MIPLLLFPPYLAGIQLPLICHLYYLVAPFWPPVDHPSKAQRISITFLPYLIHVPYVIRLESRVFLIILVPVLGCGSFPLNHWASVKLYNFEPVSNYIIYNMNGMAQAPRVPGKLFPGGQMSPLAPP